MRDEPLALRLYRRLLTLYPAGLRENYAPLMEREFLDELNESAGAGRIVLWVRLLADVAVSVPWQVSREIAQDSRHALRLWVRRPWHTGFAILALAIGIGANTGVFSMVNALLLRSLPFQEPERLASLRYFFPPHDSARAFHEWRRQSTYLADAALSEEFDVNLGGANEWRRAHLVQTSWNFFSLLGVQPIRGRAFAPGEDEPGRNQIAVIGYELWRDLFGGEARALGATIHTDGTPLTIVGIAPPGFDYPGKAVLWRPATFTRGNNGWAAIGRLKSQITWSQARQEFAADVARVDNRPSAGRILYPARILELRDQLAGPAKNGSWVLMACVVLILLIACTNVANLLLARTADRAAELSIRSAVGASRARLVQQLLTECVLLSLAAAAAGLLVASATTAIASRLQPTPLESQAYGILNLRVLGFAVTVSVLCALLFGVLPSLHAGRLHAFGTRGATEHRSSRRIREALVAGQVMLTIVLLAGSISVGRALIHLMQLDRGFVSRSLITVNVSLEGTTHQNPGSRLAYFEEALARVRRLPGVRSASATEFLPLYATGFIGGPIQMDGHPAKQSTSLIPVLSDYFRTMGGRILSGRELTDAEIRAHARLAVVNERFASEFGAPADAVGREITAGASARWKVVGVVRGLDFMADEKTTGENSNQIFIPSRTPGGFFSAFVARVEGRPETYLAEVRDAIQSVDPQVPVFGVKTMEQRLDDAFTRPRFYRTAVICFATFAIVLGVIGIYGIVSYVVARRTQEMGVRLALGTTPAHLRAKLLQRGLLPIAVGAMPGIGGAVLSGRLLESLVVGARTAEPSVYVVSVLFIGSIAVMAIWVATRPITRLDIVEILRRD